MTQVKSILLVTSDPERMLPLRRSLALLQPVQTLCLTNARPPRGSRALSNLAPKSLISGSDLPVGPVPDGLASRLGLLDPLCLSPPPERDDRFCLDRPLFLSGEVHDDAARVGLAQSGTIAAIVSDVPMRSGETVRQLRTTFEPFRLQHTPILCLIAHATARDEVQARSLGACAVLSADSSSSAVAAALRPWLHGPGQQADTPQAAAADVGLTIADMLGAALRGSRISMRSVAEASDIMLEAIAADGIHGWLRLVSDVDDRTYRHCMMVAGFVAAYALALGFSHSDCDRLTRAALLHDIGKALVPLDILNKPGPLDASEMAIMHSHAAIGHELLLGQGHHEGMTLDVVRHHHEALDGSGYPDGLQGSDISDPVRIVTICDIFTALIECRAYKAALLGDAAFQIMQDMHGKLDLHLLSKFNQVFNRGPC